MQNPRERRTISDPVIGERRRSLRPTKPSESEYDFRPTDSFTIARDKQNLVLRIKSTVANMRVIYQLIAGFFYYLWGLLSHRWWSSLW